MDLNSIRSIVGPRASKSMELSGSTRKDLEAGFQEIFMNTYQKNQEKYGASRKEGGKSGQDPGMPTEKPVKTDIPGKPRSEAPEESSDTGEENPVRKLKIPEKMYGQAAFVPVDAMPVEAQVSAATTEALPEQSAPQPVLPVPDQPVEIVSGEAPRQQEHPPETAQLPAEQQAPSAKPESPAAQPEPEKPITAAQPMAQQGEPVTQQGDPMAQQGDEAAKTAWTAQQSGQTARTAEARPETQPQQQQAQAAKLETDQPTRTEDAEPPQLPAKGEESQPKDSFSDMIDRAQKQLAGIRPQRTEQAERPETPEEKPREAQVTEAKAPREPIRKERLTPEEDPKPQAAASDRPNEPVRETEKPVKAESPARTANTPDQAKQIETEVIRNLDEQKMEFRMQLEPRELGKISVKMALEGGKLVVEIVSAAKTNELLARQVESLTASLRQSSPDLTSVQVVTESSQSGSAYLESALNGGGQDGESGQEERNGGAERNGDSALLQEAAEEESGIAPGDGHLLNYSV